MSNQQKENEAPPPPARASDEEDFLPALTSQNLERAALAASTSTRTNNKNKNNNPILQQSSSPMMKKKQDQEQQPPTKEEEKPKNNTKKEDQDEDEEEETEFELAQANNNNNKDQQRNRPALFGPSGQDDSVVERYVLNEMGAVAELDDALERSRQILESSLYQCARHSLFHIAQNREELQRHQREFDLEKLRQEFEAKKIAQKEEEIKKREANLARREEIMMAREEQLMSRDRALERIQVFAHEDLRRQRLISISNVELSEIVLEHVRRVELTAATNAPQQFFLSNVSKYLSGYNENLRKLAHSPKLDDDDDVVVVEGEDDKRKHQEKTEDEKEKHYLPHESPSSPSSRLRQLLDEKDQQGSIEDLVVRALQDQNHQTASSVRKPPLSAAPPPHNKQASNLSSYRSVALSKKYATSNSNNNTTKKKNTSFFVLVDSVPSFFYKMKKEFGFDICPLHVQGSRAIHVVRDVPNGSSGNPNQQQQLLLDQRKKTLSSSSLKDFRLNVLSSFNPFSDSVSSATVGQAYFNVELFNLNTLKTILLLGVDPFMKQLRQQHELDVFKVNLENTLKSPSIGFTYFAPRHHQSMKSILPFSAARKTSSLSASMLRRRQEEEEESEERKRRQEIEINNENNKKLEDCIVLVVGTSSTTKPQAVHQQQQREQTPSLASSSNNLARPQSAPTARGALNNSNNNFLFSGRNVEQPSSISVHSVLARIPLSAFVDHDNNDDDENDNTTATSFHAHVDLRSRKLFLKKQAPRNKWRIFEGSTPHDYDKTKEQEAAARIASALVHSGQAESDEPIPMYSASVSFDEELSTKYNGQAQSEILNRDASLFLGLMLTSPCSAVEFVNIGEVVEEQQKREEDKDEQEQKENEGTKDDDEM